MARDTAHYLRSRGPVALARFAVQWGFGRRRWYVVRGPAQPAVHAVCPPGMRVRPATADDLPHLVRFGRQSEHTLRRWLGPGYMLWVVANDRGEPIAYRCIGEQVPYAFARVLRLAERERYTVDIFVAPAFRRHRLSRVLMPAMGPALAAAGVGSLLSVQLPDNTASIAVSAGAGWSRLGTLTRWSIFGITRFTYAPLPNTDTPLMPTGSGATVEPASLTKAG